MAGARIEAALTFQVQQFFDEWCGRFLDKSFKTWGPERVKAAALDLLAINGCPLTSEDIQMLSVMEEADMIQELVARMPIDMRSKFETIAMQLQMMVASATHTRKAADSGSPEALAECCADAENGAMKMAILKQASVHAAAEVAMLHHTQDSWMRNSELRLARLTKAAETADHARTYLVAIENQLEAFHESAKHKSSKMLMGFASNNGNAMLQSVVHGWFSQMVKGRAERTIRDKMEKECERMEKELMDMKERSLKNVKGVLGRSAAYSSQGLMGQVLQSWKWEVDEAKFQKASGGAVKEMEEKIACMSQAQADGAKSVLGKMCTGNNNGLLMVSFQSWLKHVADEKQDKEVMKGLEKVEADMKAMMERNKANASGVLDRMNAATESGIKEQIFDEWRTVYTQEKSARELHKVMQANGDKFKSLKLKQSGAAAACQGRANDMMNALLLLKVFGVWQMEARLTNVDRYYSTKIDSKRRQLGSVQQIFKTFAKQLETGLSSIEDEKESARYYAAHNKYTNRSSRHSGSEIHTGKRSKGGLSKGGNAASLPDIHSRHGVLN
eukprot:CAMPEP_0195132050 /NCGR_PEP_ID=MMETSP0448-20130528/146166_1 /TAXON_ID=66468 /ORGANISM="Heterocapsa triquestra, Strain CCMP 448" /LENGTH=557 /DNA_ID=CAMNT_0040170033 /DNA_START=58 /DNA_END=1731 /DNA_ORIENTATION=+